MVPDNVINNFARTLGVEVKSDDGMDIDGDQRAKNFDGVSSTVKGLMREGYSASQILSQVSVSFFDYFTLCSCDVYPIVARSGY